MALLSFAGEEGRKKDFRGCFIFSSLSWPALWADDTNGINPFMSKMGEVKEAGDGGRGELWLGSLVWAEEFPALRRTG